MVLTFENHNLVHFMLKYLLFLLQPLIFLAFSHNSLFAMKKNKSQIVLGMGCFWCTEAIFQNLNGVEAIEVGYAGGDEPNPTYEMVCSHKTKYVEVAKISYDSQVISLEDVLRVFWDVHNPTTLNRQGEDVGLQYKSVVFYADDNQKQIAEKVLQEVKLSKDYHGYPAPIVTTIEPLKNYYPAEDYHQNYFAHNQDRPYCKSVISPKVRKFLEKHKKQLKNNLQ